MFFPLHKEWDGEHMLGFEATMEALMDDFKFFMWDGETSIDDKDDEEDGVVHMNANMEDVVHWCYTNMQKKVRSWRNRLKGKRFDPNKPNEECQTSPVSEVTNAQWKNLLEYWRSPTKEEECMRNKSSREASRPTHTTGAKSYSRCYQDMVQKGVISSELEAYLKYHQDNVGAYPNEYTKQKCEEIAQKCAQRQLEKSKNHEAFIGVLDDVYGKHHGGYERGYGGGASRRRWKATRFDRIKALPYVRQQTRLKELETENALLRERLRLETPRRMMNSHDQIHTSSSHNNNQEQCSSPMFPNHGN